MKKRRAQPPTKTFRFRLSYRPQANVWLGETQTLFNRVAAFYFDVMEAHPGVLELSDDQESLTALERLTHATTKNPNPIMPLAEGVSGNIPAMFRRAAIHAALGSARSFRSNLERWHTQKAETEEKARAKGKPCRFHTRPPVPPRQWNKSTVLYDGMWKAFDGHTVLLKVWTGASWAWVKFQVSGRAIPEGWEMGSPQIVRRGRGWYLHVPTLRQSFQFPTKVEQQLADSSTRLCAVDLNINDALAVCTIQSADGTVVATRFIRGGRALHGRRKRALGRVAVKRSQTGVISKYETDNARRFRYLRAIDHDAAHRVSRRIVEFAQEHGATIIVFEHLEHFKPEKGKYSKRGNEKRSYWLRGKISRYTQYKAWEHRILTARVNPRNTSRECADCHALVARYDAGEAPLEYRLGAPLFLCLDCLKRGNADRNASINIGHRLIERHRTPFPKPSAKSEGVTRSQGTPEGRFDAPRTREQGKLQHEARPSSNGARDWVGTAQEKLDEHSSRRIPRPLRPQRSGGYAASTPSAAYAGVPKEAPPL